MLPQVLPHDYRIHRHCFTGNWQDGQNWLQKFPDSFIGVTPLVTQHNSRAAAVRDFVQHVPLDKLLLETDSPYFIPREVSMDSIVDTLQRHFNTGVFLYKF